MSCYARDCFVIETVYLHCQIICRIPLQHFLPLFPSHVFSFSFLFSALTFLHEYLCASKWPAFANYFSRPRPPFRVAQLYCTLFCIYSNFTSRFYFLALLDVTCCPDHIPIPCLVCFRFNYILHDIKADYDTLQVPKETKPGES